MIYDTQGNIFDADAEALVNPVNCVGVMGKGLALEFKKRFPKNFVGYYEACLQKRVNIGRVYIHYCNTLRPKFILNFPTKWHWTEPSRIEYIRKGLIHLATVMNNLSIKSIAIPALGCGLGGLSWDDVYTEFKSLSLLLPTNVDIFIYAPKETK